MEFIINGTKILDDYQIEKNEELKKKLENGEITKDEYDSSLRKESEKEIRIKDGDKSGTILLEFGYDFVRVNLEDLKRILKTM